MQAQYVQELDVLIGVAKWLHSNGWALESFSVPHGRGLIKIDDAKRKLIAELTTAGVSMNSIGFRSKGEDIIAKQGSNVWKIECKGLTSGKRETVKNNFDRAVASCVSYFIKRGELRLGLALPDSEEYKKFLRDKLPQALREAIELWVFLYCSKDDIYEFAPNEAIPA